MAWLTGWSYRKQITVQDDYVDADLTMFPLYVKIVADADMSTALATGYDVRFTLSDGSTTLYYERESWSGGGGSAVTADFWVNVPSIAATGGAVVYVYWGKADAPDGQDAANTWDANYVAVYHLGEASGNVSDSSGNGNTLTPVGTLTYAQTGIIGKGLQFVSGTLEAASALIATAPMTVQAWVKLATLGEKGIVSIQQTNTSIRYMLWESSGKPTWQARTPTQGQAQATAAATAGQWALFVGRENAANSRDALLNATNKGTNTKSVSPADLVRTIIGAWCQGTNYSSRFVGIMDEVRFSNTARSDAWLTFEYRNITEADNELTWGAIEGLTAFAPRLSRQFRLGPKLVRY